MMVTWTVIEMNNKITKYTNIMNVGINQIN